MRRKLTGRARSWVSVGAGLFWVLALGIPTEAAGHGRGLHPDGPGGSGARQVDLPKPFIVRLSDHCEPGRDQAVARGVGARYADRLGLLRGFRAWMTPHKQRTLKTTSGS